MATVPRRAKSVTVSVMVLWEAAVEILDWVGRMDMLRDLLPKNLEFLISGWFRTTLILLVFLLIIYRKFTQHVARAYQRFGVRHRMISYVTAIVVGMLVGGVVGGLIWWRGSQSYAMVKTESNAPVPPDSAFTQTAQTAPASTKIPSAAEIAKEIEKIDHQHPNYGNLPERAIALSKELNNWADRREQTQQQMYAQMKPGDDRYAVFRSWDQSTTGWYRMTYEKRVIQVRDEFGKYDIRDDALDKEISERLQTEQLESETGRYAGNSDLDGIRDVAKRIAALANIAMHSN